MEKKQNRSVQALTKGVGSELKKSQDVVGKSWPRGSRRREPPGSSFASKNDTNRTKPRYMDKRPKPRGSFSYGEAAPGGKENAGLTKYSEAELGSVFVPGSKKQSLNHLLNFHYTPRGDHLETGARGGGGFSPRNGISSYRWLTTQKHKYNKEQYLQANCQFVVNSNGDYKSYMNNPDGLVDWDLIEQIHVQVSDVPSCPICLYSPVAAKMTRCGHIYCWSCVLHYLALSDKTWRKCPICYEAVHKNDLKSVVSIPHAAFNVNEYITFRLMKRAQGSLSAIPVDESKITRNTLLNMSETTVNTVYSKLLLANPAEIMTIIERERNELNQQLINDGDSEKCFIDQAIAQLDEREKSVLNALQSQATDNLSDNKSLRNEDDLSRTRFESVSSEGLGSEDFNSVPDKETCASDNIKYYYFYQATDGQQIYLHPLNIRMLEHSYGSLEHCPVTLNGRIFEKEGGSMTEELRKRLRSLQHLPVTCQFEVAEIQLKPPIVSKETLEHFQEQIDTRKRNRQRRFREEKRREKRILEEENRRMGRFPEMNVRIDSVRQFPGFSADEPELEASNNADADEKSGPSSLTGSLPQSEQYSGPSFAKMLTTGKKQIFSPGPSKLDLKPQTSIPTRVTHSDSEPEPDGYVPAPAFNQSFSDAIALALEKASLTEKELNESGSNDKRKKKNKQKKILFATSMVYSGN